MRQGRRCSDGITLDTLAAAGAAAADDEEAAAAAAEADAGGGEADADAGCQCWLSRMQMAASACCDENTSTPPSSAQHATSRSTNSKLERAIEQTSTTAQTLCWLREEEEAAGRARDFEQHASTVHKQAAQVAYTRACLFV